MLSEIMDFISEKKIIEIELDTSSSDTVYYDTSDSADEAKVSLVELLPDKQSHIQPSCQMTNSLSVIQEKVVEQLSNDINNEQTPSEKAGTSLSLTEKYEKSFTFNNTVQRLMNPCIDISSSSDDELELLPLAEKLRKKFQGKLHGTAQQILGNRSEHSPLQHSNFDKKHCMTGCADYAKETTLCRNGKEILSDTVSCELSNKSEPLKEINKIGLPGNAVTYDETEKADRRLPKGKSKLDQSEQIQLKEEARQRKRKEKELAKALKHAERETNQNFKPKESFKLMQVILDKRLMEFAGYDDLLNALHSAEVRYILRNQVIANCITWHRDTVEHTVSDDLQVNRIMKEMLEDQLAILLPLRVFIQMVHTFVESRKGISSQSSFMDQIIQVKATFPSVHLTYIVVGLEQYFSKQKKREICQFKTRMRGAQKVSSKNAKKIIDNIPVVSRVDVEEAMIDAQIQGRVNFRFVTNMSDVGNLISGFTKAIANAPFKRNKQQQQGFSWYAQGDSSDVVKVDKFGLGLSQLWQHQLQQFPGVGKEVAQAIFCHYSSPQELLKAYQMCDTALEAERLLQDIVVRRGIGPLATSRRVGPELSHKIHLFFTATDGNRLLQR